MYADANWDIDAVSIPASPQEAFHDQFIREAVEELTVPVSDADETATANIASSFSPTNTLVADRLLQRNLILPQNVLQTLLDIVNDPRCDRSQLTLKKPSDIFTYQLAQSRKRTVHRSNTTPLPWQLPVPALETIINIIESERPSHSDITKAYRQYDLLDSSSFSKAVDPAYETLSNLSLVHRSLTWSCQKAIGRRIIISTRTQILYPTSAFSMMRKALTSPLFGEWTTNAYIHDNRCDDGGIGMLRGSNRLCLMCRSDARSGDRQLEEAAVTLTHLLKRLPNIQYLSIAPYSCAPLVWPVRDMFATVPYQIKSLKQLKELTVLGVDSNGDLKGLLKLLHVAAHIPSLTRIELSTWGWSSPHWNNFDDAFSRSMLNNLTKWNSPVIGLKEFALVVTQSFPPAIVSWLFKPLKDAIHLSPTLEKLHLSIDTYDIHGPFHAPQHIEAINPFQSFRLLTELSLKIYRSGQLPEMIMHDLLDGCTCLRVLSVDHGHNLSLESVMESLPSSLECFEYTVAFKHEEFDTFDKRLSECLSSTTFMTRHAPLNILRILVTEEYKMIPTSPIIPADDIAVAPPTFQEQLQEIEGAPIPKLTETRNASETMSTRVEVLYGRSTLTTEPQHIGVHSGISYPDESGWSISVNEVIPLTLLF